MSVSAGQSADHNCDSLACLPLLLASTEQVSPQTTAEDMRALLRLHTLDDCLKLEQRDAASVLRILRVVGYDSTLAFQGLWTVPPGVSHSLWHKIYGNLPNLRTGKGNSSLLQITHRVAHYLGFVIPPTARPIPPAEVVIAHPNAEMTLEEKKAMIARLQAEVDMAQADGNNGELAQPAGSSADGNNGEPAKPAGSSTA